MKILNFIARLAILIVVVIHIIKGEMTTAGVWFCLSMLWDIRDEIEKK